MYELDRNCRPNDTITWPFAQRALGAFFVVLGLALHPSPAFAASGRYPSLDWLALTSERVELVRVVPPRDTSSLPLLVGGRIVHYQVVMRLLGRSPSSGSVRLHVFAPELFPQEGDTLLVFWELQSRADFDDRARPRSITAVNLTHPDRSYGMPALTSDFRVARNSDSVLVIVVRRVAMIRARCPLGDQRDLSLADFAQGQGCVERWMPDDSEAADVNPWGANVLASPADGKMSSSCRSRVARRLREIRAEGIPAVRRAATLVLQSLDGEPPR